MRMRVFVAGQEVREAAEFVELALGTPPELWLGEPGETEEERAARIDAARDILADDPELCDRATAAMVQVIEAHAPELLNLPSLPRAVARTRQAVQEGAAA